ncbi:hypothetical protein EH802P2_00073 [Enterococcus phage EH802P2]|nr:hypothetical protein EH802P1_00026 [Enterococcus phage EH802P1]WAX16178.1 hypothetical protein EH802P2_00073 [Enterococcus phage EH802P2]
MKELVKKIRGEIGRLGSGLDDYYGGLIYGEVEAYEQVLEWINEMYNPLEKYEWESWHYGIEREGDFMVYTNNSNLWYCKNMLYEVKYAHSKGGYYIEDDLGNTLPSYNWKWGNWVIIRRKEYERANS